MYINEVMKILHTMAGAQNGGAEMAYVDMLRAQKAQGVNVIAACRPNATRNPMLVDAGIPVYEFPFGGFFDFQTKSALKKLITQEKPDIVQTWMTRACVKTPRSGKGLPDFVKVSRLGGYYNMRRYQDSDLFIAQSPDLKRHIMEGNVPDDRVVQINQFAEVGHVSGTLTRNDLNTPYDAFVFLALARYHKNKGLDVLLQAMVDVPQAHLWLAGDGPLRQDLEDQAFQLGLSDRVHFLGWRTDRADLLDLCDAVVFPSRHEPFGTVFAQAWAAKKPLVTTASQGPAQFVKTEQDALLVDIDDVAGLSKAMNRVMTDPDLVQSLIAAGHQRYEQDFSVAAVLERTLDFYTKSLSHSSEE